ERAGNAALEEVVMNMRIRKDYYGVETSIVTPEIYRTSKLVSRITGMRVQRNKAVVGGNAFAHESGIHQDGVLKDRSTYEIFTADTVGWKGDNLIMGKHSGRNAFRSKLAELGFDGLSDEELNKAFEHFKAMCDVKKHIYDDDILAIVQEQASRVPEVYKLDYCHVVSGTSTIPSATLKIHKGEEEILQASHGDGPVDAILQAMSQAIGLTPKLEEYLIEAVTGGGDAMGRVNVRMVVDNLEVKGTGTSTDVVMASAKAFLNAFNRYELTRHLPVKGVETKEP
ncbi:TPA: 2-isopropylmalate synthase, partial [Candidatus Sumerlaeota bacterium]|nr:2-isopropylmalate synthase [Candidatus Sumerlaeota bacterium]